MMPDGTIQYTSYVAPQQNYSVSNNQWRALSGEGFASTNGNQYDLQITNFVYQSGRMYGGKHGGEPLDNPGKLIANPHPFGVSMATAISKISAGITSHFCRDKTMSLVRPISQKALRAISLSVSISECR